MSDTLRLAQCAPDQYFTYGVYTSTVFDAGAIVDWTDAEWESLGVTFWIAMEYRTGNSPTPDGTWQNWTQPRLINQTCWGETSSLERCQTHLGYIGNGRYLQYRVTFSTHSNNVPVVLYDLKIVHNLYYASGTASSLAISPTYLWQWQNVVYTATVPTSTTIRVDVISLDGTVLISDIVSGGSLNSINPTENPSIRLRATLTTDDPSLTPRLDSWSVTWTNGNKLYLPVIVR